MSELVGIVAIIGFFLVLAVVVNPYIGKVSRFKRETSGDDERETSGDDERGVSLNRNAIVGRSLGDPIDQLFFND